MDRPQLLGETKHRLSRAHGRRLRGVVLYGSEARGEAGADSDVDLLVFLDGPIDYGKDLRTNISALYDLVLALERPISAQPVAVAAYEAAEIHTRVSRVYGGHGFYPTITAYHPCTMHSAVRVAFRPA